MEELQEADVLWPADHERGRHHAARQSAARPAVRPLPSPSTSAPVRIPAAKTFLDTRRGYEDEDGTRMDSAGGSRIVPPHVFAAAARRCSSEGRTVASSVCVGHGRTLKGRDLRAVRNAVLHMTGFLGGADEY
uniref:Uncharacterized protein n=1 Tax=Leersia perrieri TaxID=77586 RepID=A0A0D9V5L6_9ORYZ